MIDPWFVTKLQDGWWLSKDEPYTNTIDPWFATKLQDGWWLSKDERRNTSWFEFLHTCCILSANTFLLFAMILGIYIVTAVDIAEFVTILSIIVAWQLVLHIKNELLRLTLKLLAPPPPDYLRMVYTTHLHKMICVAWYGQFMWAGSRQRQTKNEQGTSTTLGMFMLIPKIHTYVDFLLWPVI